MGKFLLAIDQGTSSSRTVIYDHATRVVASAQQEFPQIYPQSGWVEHDPEAIWNSVQAVTLKAMAEAAAGSGDITAIGITNQRETTLVWDRESGECVYNAIVWQDRRTAEYCRSLKSAGLELTVASKTGLRLDPYFSATKLAWILDNVEGARERAESGKLAFGTIDCFLLWRLTGGAAHATDATNASRTLLFNIHTQQWDDELLEIFNIPRELLPEVKDCAAEFGMATDPCVGGAVPVLGMAGDQQSALIGQAGTYRLHKESHQNMDAIAMFRPITKWAQTIYNAGTIAEVIRKAFKVAEAEKPGACVIELPEDIAKHEVDTPPLKPRKVRRPAADHKAVAQAVDIIAAAKNPAAASATARTSRPLKVVASLSVNRKSHGNADSGLTWIFPMMPVR